jgi:hydroxymethylpyrimidine pyrophosphatase-like HAD family hydrolase
MTRPRPLRLSLLLADVDGTLVTRDKVLTERAARAVRALRGRGVRLAITSGRPPRGMAMLVEPLALDLPIAGFNGGLFVRPDLSVIEGHELEAGAARRAASIILDHGSTSGSTPGPTGCCAIPGRRTSRGSGGR